jgi:asparagine synthase (glutamine-hydrolysing)
LGTTAEETLNTFCQKTDFLEPKGVKRILKSGSANQIWYLLNFALWWNEFIDE